MVVDNRTVQDDQHDADGSWDQDNLGDLLLDSLRDAIPENLRQEFDQIATQLDSILDRLSQLPLIGGLFGQDHQQAGYTPTDNLDPASQTRNYTEAAETVGEQELMQQVTGNPFLSFMAGGTNQNVQQLINAARNFNRLPANQINHNFNVLNDHQVFPHSNGRLCCAHYVSTVLGITAEPGSVQGSFGSVNQNLLPYLINRNLERNNNPGIVLGYENMIKGDVIAFQGTTQYAPDRYGHVGIVRDKFNYNGVDYILVQHEATNIQVECIPVNPADADLSQIQSVYSNPALRQIIPELQSAYEYRSQFPNTVRFTRNRGYYGDASKGRGRAAFAVRTA
jgi:hypothetical protein